MALRTEEKKRIIDAITFSKGSTGSTEAQIALLTEKIHKLNFHLKKNIHDFSSKRGLLVNVGKRRKLLRYLSSTNPTGYETVLKKLNLRK